MLLALLVAACVSSSKASVQTPSSPPPLVAGPTIGSGSMTFDESSAELVLVDPSGGGTWTWDGAHAWQRRLSVAEPATLPIKVGGPPFGLAWDAAGGSTIAVVGDLLAGIQSPEPAPATWSWRAGSWKRIDTAHTPNATGGAVSAFPPAHQLLMFSGCCTAAARQMIAIPGMWSWDGSAWTPVHPAHMPPARWGRRWCTTPRSRGS